MKPKRYKSIYDMKPKDYSKAMDIRGNPTTVCPCGCNVWTVKLIWDADDGTVDMYFLDMECSMCGTRATAPTPIDAERID
jgi:hypothetical protein